MGIRRILVARLVCDVCKIEIEDGARKVGTLQVKTEGARGRGEQWTVAFHEKCYRALVSEATKPNGRGRAKAKGTRGRRAKVVSSG